MGHCLVFNGKRCRILLMNVSHPVLRWQHACLFFSARAGPGVLHEEVGNAMPHALHRSAWACVCICLPWPNATRPYACMLLLADLGTLGFEVELQVCESKHLVDFHLSPIRRCSIG